MRLKSESDLPVRVILSMVTAGFWGTIPTSVPAEVTFNRDIAPILFEHCAACHRPGQSAPFSLLTYSDARKRARQIGTVTRSGYMPPWLPEAGQYELEGSRRLSAAQIGLIEKWIAGDLVEGDPQDLPEIPKWSEGWYLGKPDLILKMKQEYVLRPEGPDAFRSFIIPVPITAPRYVKAVELRPGNPRIVHHAIMYIDKSQSARRLDAEDKEPGYDGMRLADIQSPGGQFIGWTPGKLPLPSRDQMAWRLDPGTDIVLEMHMLPSGKPEPVRASIGLFFTDEPPSRQPISVLLYSKGIDIEPGVRDYIVEEKYTFPVDSLALGIYPHAHYLGKDLHAFVVLPNGEERSLLRIKDWDFNWQDDYRYADPVSLPKDSTLYMRYSFDNSDTNVRNPSSPPVHVSFGSRSTDEMASLTLEVITQARAEEATLQSDYEKYLRDKRIQEGENQVIKTPDDPLLRFTLGVLYARDNNHGSAATHFARAVELEPKRSMVRNQLGLSLQALGRHEDATLQFQAVLKIDPENVNAHQYLANALYRIGRIQESQAHRQKAAELAVKSAEAALKNIDRFLTDHGDEPVRLYNLANALHTVERHDEAIMLYEKALEAQESTWRMSRGIPNFMLHHNLAGALSAVGRFDEAIKHYQETVELRPGDAQTHVNLANVLQQTQRNKEAMEHYQHAVELDPHLAPARFNFAIALRSQRRFEDSAEQLRAILKGYPHIAIVHYYLGDVLDRLDRVPEAVSYYREALRLAEESGESSLVEKIRERLSTEIGVEGR